MAGITGNFLVKRRWLLGTEVEAAEAREELESYSMGA
jgi:hypothetical protein